MSPIARLKGVVLERGPDWLIVDVGGVGFLVYSPAGTLSRAQVGGEIALHTHLSVREDGMALYGFASGEEQRLFQALLSVSGVGPRAALSLLSTMRPDELSFAIASGNAAALARAPGVGQKMASRIVLELRGRLTDTVAAAPSSDDAEVIAALVVLGYTQAEAVDAVARAGLPPDATVAEKVRLALQYFGRAKAGS